MQERLLEEWIGRGPYPDPKSTVIDADARDRQDTVLLPHTVIEQGSDD